MTPVMLALDLLGVAVFAISGALVASRKEMDPVGFALMASFAGVGGGTLRDLILDRPVFWLAQPAFLAVCFCVGIALFFGAARIERRFTALLWADALGLAAYCVMGASVALASGAPALSAVLMGVMTASFGGLIRDVIGGEIPLILRRELYATAAAAGAALFVGLSIAGAPRPLPALLGFALALCLRAGAIAYGWSLPRYRARPGRDFPP